MNFRKIALMLVLTFAVAAVAAPSFVHAMGDEATLATFRQPVEIPGLVLPAGTYLFQFRGGVVQVWDANRTTLYATLMTVPAYRPEVADAKEFQFEERATGAPKAIGTWYFNGGKAGEEFVYPGSPSGLGQPQPNTALWSAPNTRWWAK
jgi:hypothetical protein